MRVLRSRFRNPGLTAAHPSHAATRRLDDGREVCLANEAGRAEYEARRRELWQRQQGLCALATCQQRMALADTRLTHGDWAETGQLRDDRLIDKQGVPINHLVHKGCLRAWHRQQAGQAGQARPTEQSEAKPLKLGPAIILLTVPLAVLALSANPARAQGAPISNQVITPFSTPAPNVPVRVCAITATGTPCSTAGVTLYSDVGLSHVIGNPASTDQYGNYSLFTVAGLYQVQITVSPGIVYTYAVSAGGAGGGSSAYLLRTNNLSDLTSVPTALTNLGLGATSTPTFQMVNTLSPMVYATNPLFGTPSSCPNAADPTGVLDSTCAINAAKAYSKSVGVAASGTGYEPVFLPAGQYKIYSSTYTAAIEVDDPISFIGDDQGSTILDNSTSPYADALFYTGINNGNCNLPVVTGSCPYHVERLTIIGGGHATTGSGLTLLNAADGYIDNVRIINSGGVSLNVTGGTERSRFTNIDINHSRIALLNGGDQNENYYRRLNPLFPGSDSAGYCYNVANCPGGVANTSGTWYADPHAQINLRGVNVDFEDFSAKGLQLTSCVKILGGENILVDHGYCEGNQISNGSPAINHGVQVLGKNEIGHLTAGITTSALTIPIDDAIYMPVWLTDPAFATTRGTHANDGLMWIGPQDASWGSTTPSAYVPGITQGTYEAVYVYTAAADQALHLVSRAVNGTTAIAWPAGSVVAPIQPGTYGSVKIQDIHLTTDGPSGFNTSAYTVSCNDTGRLPLSTLGTIYGDTSEVIAGIDPDGFTQPLPSTRFVGTGTGVLFSGNSFYVNETTPTCNAEQLGQGFIKVPASAQVTIGPNDSVPLHTGPYNITNLLNGLYQNGDIMFQFVNWGSAAPSQIMPQGIFFDINAGVTFYPISGTLGSFIGKYIDPGSGSGNAVATQTLNPGASCTYAGNYLNAGTASTERQCLTNGSFNVDFNNGTGYTNQFTLSANGATYNPALKSNTSVTAPFFSGLVILPPQIMTGTGTISSTVSQVDFNFAAAGTATMPTCSSALNNQNWDLFNAGTPNVNVVTLNAGGSDLQINGTLTGNVVSSVTVPPGAHWIVRCNSNINGYFENRVNTNGGPAFLATGILDPAQNVSSTVVPGTFNNELTGTFALTLAGTAATAGQNLIDVQWPMDVDRTPPQVCSAFLSGGTISTYLTTSAVNNFATNSFVISTPAALPIGGPYAISYQCTR